MRDLSPPPSRPPPPPSSASCFYGYNAKSVVFCILFPLVLVSLGLFALDSRSYASWFSSYASSLTRNATGSWGALSVSSRSSRGGSGRSYEGPVEFEKEVHTSGHGSYFSPVPVGAPSPAPEPVNLSQSFSISSSLQYLYFLKTFFFSFLVLVFLSKCSPYPLSLFFKISPLFSSLFVFLFLALPLSVD